MQGLETKFHQPGTVAMDTGSVIRGYASVFGVLDQGGDIMFGLADIGYPELGSWSLEELRRVRLPFGMGIERDLLFTGDFPISVWAEAAREAGSIRAAERALYRAGAAFTCTSADTESQDS